MIKNIRPGGKGSFTEDYELQLNVPPDGIEKVYTVLSFMPFSHLQMEVLIKLQGGTMLFTVYAVHRSSRRRGEIQRSLESFIMSRGWGKHEQDPCPNSA